MNILKGTKLIWVVLICIIALLVFGSHKDRETLYQVSVLSGLMNGDYAGKVSLDQIRKHGDFGIGTFDRLDGEAIELDGVFYQVGYDGAVRRMPGNLRSPFAMVKFFGADLRFPVKDIPDFKFLQDIVDCYLKSKNIPYAVKIEGKFKYIKVRSVPAQSKPYPALAEVIKKQSVFEYRDIEGTLVGFRMPDYMNGANTPGYHAHFLSRDKTQGGHLLDCSVGSAEVAIDDIKRFDMVLPGSADFYSLNFAEKAVPNIKTE
jgi:acetolactate decarboxylase